MASVIQAVWVVHGDPSIRSRILTALESIPNVKVETAPDPFRLPSTENGAPRLVLADATNAKRLIKVLDTAVPSTMRLFLCPMSDASAVRGLVRLAAEGHSFLTLDDALPTYQLHQHLSSLLHGRLGGRVAPQAPSGLHATFDLEGRRLKARVLDIASHGLGLALEIESLIELLSPGTSIEKLQLTRSDDTLLLETAFATIRHIQVVQEPDRAYFRLGVSLPSLPSRETPRMGDSPIESVKDPVRIASLLRRAVHHQSPFKILQLGGSHLHFPAQGVEMVNVAPRRMGLVINISGGLDVYQGDLLEIHFEFGGQGYWGVSSAITAVEDGRVMLSVPPLLQLQHRRVSPRFAPQRTDSVVVTFVSPLTGEQLVRPILDLHSGGLSFMIDEDREPFPPGLLVPELTLRFSDGRAFKTSGTIRGSRPLQDAHGFSLAGIIRPGRCGMSLSKLAPDLAQAILASYVNSRYPELTEASTVPFESVWNFMAEVHRFSPDYPHSIGPHVKTLGDVQRKLEHSATVLGKAYAQKTEGHLTGYVSGLRIYSKTWLVQHLAVNRGFHRRDTISQKLTSLAVEYGEALPDIDFIRYDWFTANRWPHRMSLWVASNLSSPGLTRIRYVNDMRLSGDLPDVSRALPSVRRATEPDLVWLENYLKLQGDVVAMRSDDLTAKEFNLESLGVAFEQSGLYRSRSIFVVDGATRPLAFGLMETGTPGLCWAEFTNAFKVVPTASDSPDLDAAREALVRHCVQAYRSSGRRNVIALCSDAETEVLTRMEFQSLGRLGEFTFHKSLARRWQALSTAMFERLGDRDLPVTPGSESEEAA